MTINNKKINIGNIVKLTSTVLGTISLIGYSFFLYYFRPNNYKGQNLSFKDKKTIETIVDSVYFDSNYEDYDPTDIMRREDNQYISVDVLVKDDKKIICVPVQHVAEKDYYNVLKEQFLDPSDVVLYEYLVVEKKEGVDVESEALNNLKTIMSKRLDLSLYGVINQTNAFDYDNLPDNWVHADLIVKSNDQDFKKQFKYSPVSMGKLNRVAQLLIYSLMGKRDELNIAYKNDLISEISNNHNRSNEVSLNSKREDKLFKVLDEKLESDDFKSIAIFYGYGHMPYILDKIVNDYSFQPEKKYWLVASRLTKKNKN